MSGHNGIIKRFTARRVFVERRTPVITTGVIRIYFGHQRTQAVGTQCPIYAA
jgi:hypothetical protein